MKDEVIREAGADRRFLTPAQLAERWGITLHSLMMMRREGRGARYLQMKERGRVLYPLEEVEAHEAASMRTSYTPRLSQGGSRHGS